jgi:hypothetical protein
MDKTRVNRAKAMLSDTQFASTHLDGMTEQSLLDMNNRDFFRLYVLYTDYLLHTASRPKIRKIFRAHAATIRGSEELANRMWIVWSDILADEGYSVIMQELFEMVLVARHEGKHALVEDLMTHSYELYNV